jgi:putative ABC transport system substrate-binding protein
MTRRTIGFLVVLALGLLVAPLIAAAPPAKTAALRIGILSPWSPSGAPGEAAFRPALAELGYVEGDSLRLEYRSAAGDDERFPVLAAELVALKVDVLVAATVPAIRAAQRATTTIPIVMTFSSDPVRLGLVKSLARPGGNTTGVASLTFDLAPKCLELLKEIVPQLRQVAVLWNPANPAIREGLSLTDVAARALGASVRPFEVSAPGDVDAVFAAILRERPDGLVVLPDPFTYAHRGRIVQFAANNRLPAIYSARDFVDAGGLISYGISWPDQWRGAARYIERIAHGVKPADLPVELPMTFELVINLKTAAALGITIPPTLLFQADEIIR